MRNGDYAENPLKFWGLTPPDFLLAISMWVHILFLLFQDEQKSEDEKSIQANELNSKLVDLENQLVEKNKVRNSLYSSFILFNFFIFLY